MYTSDMATRWYDKPSAPRTTSLQADDVILTIVMLLGACQDLTWGLLRLWFPEWTLENVSSFNQTDITLPMVRLTRVGGWGNLESGILGLLLVTWRIVLWYTRRPFQGQNFQFGFALTTVGKTGAFITNASLSGWEPFAAGAPRDNILLFTRAVFAFCSLLLSLYTYSETWQKHFLRQRP